MDVPDHIKSWMKFEAFLKDLTGLTKEILEYLHGQSIDYEYKCTLYKFIERFHLNFVTIKNTWKDYLNIPKFRHPFYVLIRSLISDYIIMLYLVEGLKFEDKTEIPNEEDFHRRYSDLSKAYFLRLDREIQRLISDKKVTPKQREEFLQMEKKFYPEFFEAGNKIRVRKGPNLDLGTIIKKLKKGNFKKLTGIYQYYFYFSQYEHFTIKTEELLENDRDGEFQIFAESVDYLVRGLLLIIFKMRLDIKFIEQLTSLIDEFEEKFRK